VEILNLGGASDNNSSAPKTGKRLRVLLGIGALAAVTGIGSTLAANITLNNEEDVEFGQGVVQTTSCDPTSGITVAPVSDFDNTATPSASPLANPGVFFLESIVLSDIDSACDTKWFAVKAYDESGASSIYETSFQVATAETEPGTKNIDVSSANLEAANVFKITVESSDTDPLAP
jgi:hypothetical protein